MAQSKSKLEATPILARTPLYDLAVEKKARLTAFSGWEMPVQYSGLKQEHQAVRTTVGMFDISHMGKFALRGNELLQKLQKLVPSDLERLQPGQAQYTVLLNPQGGIIDDVIVYFQGTNAADEEQGLMIVNAATTTKDKAWLLANLDPTIELKELPGQILMALQGPQAATVLEPFVEEKITSLKAFEHITGTIFSHPAFVARTGYTGEDGFEIMVDSEVGSKLWRSLDKAGVTPCGLGARDTLRLEAALALYGQDIDENTTPYEAGLGWLVHLKSKGDFIGRSVLEEQKAGGAERKLVGIQMRGRYIARHGYRVLFDGKAVGEVTSGTLAPTLGKAIALAYVPASLSQVGQELDIEIRGKSYPATVVKKPFYRSPHRL